MKKTGFLALSLALILICGGVFASQADPVVIQVGDSAILLSEAQAYFDNLYTQYSVFYANYGQTIPAEEVAQIRDDTIRELSLLILLEAKVQEYGLGEITDADRQTLWEESSMIYEESVRMEAEERGLSAEQVEEERASFGMTLEFQFNNMLEMLPYTRLYNHVTEGVTVDDAALQKAYETYVQQDKDLYANDIVQYEFNQTYANASALFRPEGYRAINHILLPIPEALAFEIHNAQADLLELNDEIDALNEELKSIENGGQSSRTAEQVKAEIEQKQQGINQQEQVYEAAKQQILPQIQGTIEEINGKLTAGESFASLGAQYGRNETFPMQDDGTCHVHKDSILFDDAFLNAATSLSSIGEYALTVTDFGVYIVQYVENIAGGPVPMNSDITDTLRMALLEDEKSAHYETLIEQWQQQTPMEAHPELIVIPELDALLVEMAPDGMDTGPTEEDGSMG